ncbi:unnamed protein product, partial [Rotaria magnacalcarata]
MALKSDQTTSTMSNGAHSVDQTQMPFLE